MPKLVISTNEQPTPDEIVELALSSKLIFFDLDGTFANTEKIHLQAYNNTFTTIYNSNTPPHIDKDEFVGYLGLPETEIYRRLEQKHKVIIDRHRFMNTRFRLVKEIIGRQGVEPYTYVVGLLELLDINDVPYMILTSQHPEIVSCLVDGLGLSSYFPEDKIINCSQSEYNKRDVFVNPVQFVGDEYPELSIGDASEMTVFEDSPHWLSVGRECGLHTVAVAHEFNMLDVSCGDYDIVIDCR